MPETNNAPSISKRSTKRRESFYITSSRSFSGKKKKPSYIWLVLTIRIDWYVNYSTTEPIFVLCPV